MIIANLLDRQGIDFHFSGYDSKETDLTAQATVNGVVIDLFVARTIDEMQRGLGGKKSILSNQGMLFDLKVRAPASIWMKDMNFPLDILWIDGDRIVEISPHVPVITNEGWTRVQSKDPINKIIELNSGMAQRWGLSPGQRVRIDRQNKFYRKFICRIVDLSYFSALFLNRC